MHNPGLGIIGNDRLPGLMWSVLYADLSADLKGLIDPFQHALACHFKVRAIWLVSPTE